MVLGGINLVAWDRLRHANGVAVDVPQDLRELQSGEAQDRDSAFNRLYGTIWHQGSVYQATLEAIPFLFEIAMDNKLVDRSTVVELLVAIAIGCESDYLPFDYDQKAMVANWTNQLQKVPKLHLEKTVVGPHVNLKAFRMVEANIEVLVAGFENKFSRFRSACYFGLSWFPEKVGSLPAMRQQLLSKRLEENELCNLILAIGFLGFQLDCSVENELGKFRSHESNLVKLATGIAIARTDVTGWSSEVLTQASKDESFNDLYPRILFYDGDLQGYARRVLEDIGNTRRAP